MGQPAAFGDQIFADFILLFHDMFGMLLTDDVKCQSAVEIKCTQELGGIIDGALYLHGLFDIFCCEKIISNNNAIRTFLVFKSQFRCYLIRIVLIGLTQIEHL